MAELFEAAGVSPSLGRSPKRPFQATPFQGVAPGGRGVLGLPVNRAVLGEGAPTSKTVLLPACQVPFEKRSIPPDFPKRPASTSQQKKRRSTPPPGLASRGWLKAAPHQGLRAPTAGIALGGVRGGPEGWVLLGAADRRGCRRTGAIVPLSPYLQCPPSPRAGKDVSGERGGV